MSGSRTRNTAIAGLLAGAVSAVLVLAAPWSWLTMTGSLLLVTVAPGAAVMCWIDSGDPVAQAGMTLVTSVAVFALASAFMIWLSAWHPRALLSLSVAAMLSCFVRLRAGAG